MRLTHDIQVLPITDLVDHDESRECWCGPRIEAKCTEEGCDGDCWRCVSGWMVVDKNYDDTAIVIHNAADGRL